MGNGKSNCWEVKKCGREPGGAKVKELGECPAATHRPADGINHGANGGRLCWAVAGTLCGGKVQGTFAQKHITCLACEFYLQVKKDEEKSFTLLMPGQGYTPTTG